MANEAHVDVKSVTKITSEPHICKYVTRTLQTTDTKRNTEAVLIHNNAHHLNVGKYLYPDGPEKNAP